MSADRMTFRDRAEHACPKWARGWWLSRLLYAIFVQFDALVDWANYAVHLRYPSWCAEHCPEALAIHGRSRGIRRGFAESGAAYAARLVQWVPGRKRRGNLFVLMDQLAGYLSGFAVTIRCVNINGAWCTRIPDGTREYHRADPTNWDWDGNTAAWSRYWVILYPPADLWTDDGTWDDPGTWDDGGTWDTTATPDQVATIRAIVAEENPPHAKCAGILISLNGTDYSPLGSGAGFPAGDWGTWGHLDGTHYEAVRADETSYWDGI